MPASRLSILAKGNADVRDSLHLLTEDGRPVWDGLNAVLRGAGHPPVRLRHETMTRADALLAPPPPLDRPLPLGPFPIESQRETRLFDGTHDAIILSLQPEVMHRLARHRSDNHLFFPYEAEHWPTADRRWLAEHYAPAPPPEPDEAMANLAALIARIREAGDPAILILNLSPAIPGEAVHSYRGLSGTLGERIRRFNLALVDLSRAVGIAIVDVEGVVTRLGLARAKLDAVTLTPAGARAVAEEVARILADLGLLAPREAAA